MHETEHRDYSRDVVRLEAGKGDCAAKTPRTGAVHRRTRIRSLADELNPARVTCHSKPKPKVISAIKYACANLRT